MMTKWYAHRPTHRARADVAADNSWAPPTFDVRRAARRRQCHADVLN